MALNIPDGSIGRVTGGSGTTATTNALAANNNFPCVLIVDIVYETQTATGVATSASPPSGGGYTYTLLNSISYHSLVAGAGGNWVTLERWYAPSPASQPNGFGVTVTSTVSCDEIDVDVYSASGTRSSAPFFNLAGSYAIASPNTPSSIPTLTGISTGYDKTAILAFTAMSTNASDPGANTVGAIGAVNPATLIDAFDDAANTAWTSFAFEFALFSSAQSGIAASFGTSWPSWAMLVDTILDAAAVPSGGPSTDMGMPRGTIFTPGKGPGGPSSGMDFHRADAFPPPIPFVQQGIPRGTIFVPGRGPSKGIRSPQSFPVPISLSQALTASTAIIVESRAGSSAKAALAAQTTFPVKGQAGPSGKVPLQARAFFPIKGLASEVGKTALSAFTSLGVRALAGINALGIQVGMPSGFLFKPGAGPTWNLRGRQAFPVPIPIILQQLTAQSALQAKGTAAATGALKLTAQSFLPLKGTAAAKGVVGLATRAIAMLKGSAVGIPTVLLKATGLILFQGRPSQTAKLSLLTQGLITVQVRAAAAGKLSLATVGKLQLSGRNAITVVSNLVAFVTQSIVQFKGTTALTGKTPLQAKVIVGIKGVAAPRGVAALVARAALALKGSAGATFLMQLVAKTTLTFKGLVTVAINIPPIIALSAHALLAFMGRSPRLPTNAVRAQTTVTSGLIQTSIRSENQ